MKRYNRQTVEMLVSSGECTVAATDGTTLVTSAERGIKPLLDWLEQGVNIEGYCVADKIVGKAAALLYVDLRVAHVTASVMSGSGAKVLADHGIDAACGILADAIVNRTGTGICPMEETVAEIDDPVEAERALRKKAASLRK